VQVVIFLRMGAVLFALHLASRMAWGGVSPYFTILPQVSVFDTRTHMLIPTMILLLAGRQTGRNHLARNKFGNLRPKVLNTWSHFTVCNSQRLFACVVPLLQSTCSAVKI